MKGLKRGLMMMLVMCLVVPVALVMAGCGGNDSLAAAEREWKSALTELKGQVDGMVNGLMPNGQYAPIGFEVKAGDITKFISLSDAKNATKLAAFFATLELSEQEQSAMESCMSGEIEGDDDHRIYVLGDKMIIAGMGGDFGETITIYNYLIVDSVIWGYNAKSYTDYGFYNVFIGGEYRNGKIYTVHPDCEYGEGNSLYLVVARV